MNDVEHRLLVLAPTAGDAALTEQLLAHAGGETTFCDSVETICREAEAGVGVVLLVEEALVPPAMDCLLAMLRRQPPWSDLPIMILMGDAAPSPLTPGAVEALGNVVLLERPLREATLISTVRMALRGRRRQYEHRDLNWEHAALVAEHASLHRELEAAVQIRDRFLSIASHELRTPLTSLLGYTSLLQRGLAGGELAPAVQRALRTISLQAMRLNLLIEQLLDVSRLQRGQFTITEQPLDFGELVARVVDEFGATVAPRPVSFTQRSGPVVLGDPLRLEQVLQNLLGNAVKYSPAGGPVEVWLDQDAREAILEVRDTGVGIPAAAQPHLFEPYYRSSTTSSRISGFGIGLFVVREIVARHGGRTEVESAEGRGSTFRVHLPLLLPAPGGALTGALQPEPFPAPLLS